MIPPYFRPVLVAAMLTMLACVLPSFAQPLFRWPFVGNVTDRAATVLVWCSGGQPVGIEYDDDSTFATPQQTAQVTPQQSEDFVLKITLQGLLSSTRYHYRVVDAAGGRISPTQSFTTFPVAGTDAPVTLLFGSCNRASQTATGKTFDVGGGLGGDYFIHLGDWSYPDVLVPGFPNVPGTIRQSYATRLDTTYPLTTKILSQMGIAYEWDDHDFAGNNGDGSIPPTLKNELLQAYQRYQPHYPLANPQGGVWHSFRVGNVEVFMMDSRTQRSPVDSAFRDGKFAPAAGHSMLSGYPVPGVDQRTWLLQAIRNSTARWKVLASQGPFNPGLAPLIPAALLVGRPNIARETAEYWVGYPADLDSLRKLLKTEAGRNFLIITGSVHNNLFDDGSHSVVPEFVAANLDVPNSFLYDTLRRYGFNVFTGGQTNGKSTIGRLRVETVPVHRLIVEAFDEDGELSLRYEMADKSSGVAAPQADRWPTVETITFGSDGREVMVQFTAPLPSNATATITDLQGNEVARWQIEEATSVMRQRFPASLPSGAYLGKIVGEGYTMEFRGEVIK